MAKVITFFPKRVYMGDSASVCVNLSEIFEIEDDNQLEVEMRVYATLGVMTGEILTTSDPTFVDSSWMGVSGTFTQSGTGIKTVSLSGFGRFVRASLTVPQAAFACVCMNAVARAL